MNMKSTNIMARVEPILKEQAEEILSELGISMSAAMVMYLRQIVLRRGIPFEVSLPNERPIPLSKINDERFNQLMDEAVQNYESDKCTTLANLKSELSKEVGL